MRSARSSRTNLFGPDPILCTQSNDYSCPPKFIYDRKKLRLYSLNGYNFPIWRRLTFLVCLKLSERCLRQFCFKCSKHMNTDCLRTSSIFNNPLVNSFRCTSIFLLKLQGDYALRQRRVVKLSRYNVHNLSIGVTRDAAERAALAIKPTQWRNKWVAFVCLV